MTMRVDSKTIAPGAVVEAVVKSSGIKPEKKDTIVGGTQVFATALIKYIEIHLGIPVPWFAEIFIVTFLTSLASYFTKERLVNGTFLVHQITPKDIVNFFTSLIVTSGLKAYEEVTGFDATAEREVISGVLVGIVSALVPTRILEVVAVKRD